MNFFLGIPANVQNLIFNNNVLNDETEVKDVPLVEGSRLKLILDMKGGPVSARRFVKMQDFESDLLNEVLR